MKIDVPSDDHWEVFTCTSCGWEVTRLKGSFDAPVCAECRWYTEADPTGKLRRERKKEHE
jgi:hypothetical protein